MNRVRIKLTKIPEKLSKKGGYRARVLDNGVVDFDEFVQEVVDKSGFRMEPRMLKMWLFYKIGHGHDGPSCWIAA